MDEYYRVAETLPQPLAEELGTLSTRYAPHIQEIRLRAGQPVYFTIKGKLSPCGKYLPAARRITRLGCEELQTCFLHLCRHSVYAYEQELKQGFFTLPGGSRVGVAGSWTGSGFSTVTSLNLRVARWITCDLTEPVQEHLCKAAGGLLVAGAPGSGKTTFLRSVIEYLGSRDNVLCVVDERAELLAGQSGGLFFPGRARCDVYTRCPKAEGICMALRCMNPQYILCDELGTRADATAVEQGLASGVCFVASVHCEGPEVLHTRPQLERLLQTGAFSGAVFLDGREKPGTVARWMELT